MTLAQSSITKTSMRLSRAAFPPESLFAITPESRSSSSRNDFRFKDVLSGIASSPHHPPGRAAAAQLVARSNLILKRCAQPEFDALGNSRTIRISFTVPPLTKGPCPPFINDSRDPIGL